MAGSGLGTVDVILTNSDGQSDTLTSGYTYVGPNITGLTSAKGSPLGGYQAVFRGENFPVSGGGLGRALTINNSNGQTLSDYQVAFTLDTQVLVTAGKMRADCGDLRVVGEGNAELPYWVESGCNTSETKVWFKVASLAPGTNDFFVTYDRPQREDASDPDSVFLFFDDFERGNFDRWDTAGGMWTLDTNGFKGTAAKGQRLNNSNERLLRRDLPLTAGVVNFKIKIDNYLGVYYPNNARVDNNREYINHGQISSYFGSSDVVYDTSSATAPSKMPVPTILNVNTWYDYEYLFDYADEEKFWLNIDGQSTTPSGLPALDQNGAAVDIWDGLRMSTNYNENTMWIDEVIVRTYAKTEPTTVLGDEENLGTVDLTFGDAVAERVQVLDSENLTARVPASTLPGDGRGTVVVTLTTPLGNTATTNFEYSAPEITAITPAEGAIEGGSEVTIEGTGFAGGTGGGLEREVTVTNSGASSLSQYPVRLSVDTASLIAEDKMRPDCGDVRVLGADDTELPYWIEDGSCNTEATQIWAKVPTVAPGDTLLKLGYGDEDLTSAADGEEVFTFFSDFSGLGDEITYPNGYYEFKPDGTIELWGNNAYQTIYGANETLDGTTGFRVVSKFKTPQISGNNWHIHAVDDNSDTYQRVNIFDVAGVSGVLDSQVAPNTNYTTIPDVLGNWSVNQWYLGEVKVTPGSSDFVQTVYNPDYSVTGTDTQSSGAYRNRTWKWRSWSYQTNIRNSFDFVFAAPYAENEPSVSVSPTENSAIQVQFGSKTATATLEESGNIVAFVPPSPLSGNGSGSVDVTVTNPDGSSVTETNGFAYRLPELYGVTPTEGPSTGGNDVVVTGKYLSEARTYALPLIVTNPTQEVLVDAEVLLELNTRRPINEGKMREDCGNLRILNTDDIPLDFYIESGCDTAKTLLWVKIPSLASGETTLYADYGAAENYTPSVEPFSFAPLVNNEFLPPASLPATANLQLHLDAQTLSGADGSAVSGWVDQSGQGNDAGQATADSQPTLVENVVNGQKAVRFDGLDDYLEKSFEAELNAAEQTIITVAAPTRLDANYGSFVTSRDDNAGRRGYSLYKTNQNKWEFRTGAGTASANWYLAVGGPVTSGKFEVLVSELDQPGNLTSLYQNGTLAAATSGAVSLNTSKPLRIGSGATEGSPDFFLHGDIAEVLIYDTILSEAERRQVECYLANKYGLSEVESCPRGVRLWLQSNTEAFAGLASGASVAQWPGGAGTSESGIQNNPANRPTLQTAQVNGLPAVRFGGEKNLVTANALNFGPNVSVYAVARPGTASGYKRIVENVTDYSLFSGVLDNKFSSFYGNGTVWNETGNNQGNGLSTEKFSLLTTINDGSDNSYVNGVAEPETPEPDVLGSFEEKLSIGGRENFTGQNWDGDIAELLVIDTETLARRETIERYLNQKYRLYDVENLPKQTATGTETSTALLTLGGQLVENLTLENGQTFRGQAPAGSGLDQDVVYTSARGNRATLGGVYDYGVNLPPNAIADLTLEQPASGVITLSWSAPNDNGQEITDYVIKYATQSDFSDELIYGDGTNTATSVTIDDLDIQTAYYFKVIAVNSVGPGPASNVVQTLPADCDVDYGGSDLLITNNQVLIGVHCNIGEFQVDSGVTLTLAAQSHVQIYAQSANILGTINGQGKGFPLSSGTVTVGQGPGAGTHSGDGNVFPGPSHGGVGGRGFYNVQNGFPAPAYGSVEYPTTFGSSGGNALDANSGGAGGGAFQLTVTGALTLDGTVNVNGAAPANSTYRGSGGAGGSVLINADTISGSGVVTAIGGSSTSFSGGAGGGRIAIHSANNSFEGSLNAKGGQYASRSQTGGAGTIYISDSNGRKIIVDNQDATPNTYNNALSRKMGLTPLNADLLNETSFELEHNNALVELGDSLELRGEINIDEDSVLYLGPEVTFPSPPNLTVAGELEVSGLNTRTFDDIFITSTGYLTHKSNSTTEEHKVNFTGNALTIENGGQINTNGRGYAQNQGPGRGGSSSSRSGGGGYGGRGGDASSTAGGSVYGSKSQPAEIGSGGGKPTSNSGTGGKGGGSVKLAISGDVVNNGAITANGENGLVYGSGGSGGSVWIEANNISGEGLIEADGGDGTTQQSPPPVGAGGGGRIALYYQDRNQLSTTTRRGELSANEAQNGTIYEHQIPESALASAIFVSNPSPVGVNAPYRVAVENILNVHGNPLRDGFYDKVTCAVSVIDNATNGATYSENLTGGTVADGVCTLPAEFGAPSVVGDYTATLTVTGTDAASTTETTDLTFAVVGEAANLAARQSSFSSKPRYATLTPGAAQLIGDAVTITSAGYVDRDNGAALNGVVCTFLVTGPEAFEVRFTGPEMVGGKCRYDFAGDELPDVPGTYTVLVEVPGDDGAGGTTTLVTDSVDFERVFDIKLDGAGEVPGTHTSNNTPLIGDEANTLTSPAARNYFDTEALTGLACRVYVTDNTNTDTFASTVDETGRCLAFVPADTLAGDTVTTRTEYDLVVNAATYTFTTTEESFALVGSPSDKAFADANNPNQPVYSQQLANPDPSFVGENFLLLTRGFLDSTTTNPLENAACDFTLTNPNDATFNLSTNAAGGDCAREVASSEILENNLDVPGTYQFFLNIVGENGTLTTPSVSFERIYNVALTNDSLPGVLTINPNPAVQGQTATITSPRLRAYNGTTDLPLGTPCANILTLNNQPPLILEATLNASGFCVATTPTLNVIGPATMRTRVTVAGREFTSAATPTEVKPLNTAQICALVFRDDAADASYDTGEVLLGGVELQLKDKFGSLINKKNSLASGYQCFGSLFDGEYVLQVVSPGGTRTLPASGATHAITLAAGVVENRVFGFNGDARVCPGPIYNDVNENGQFDAGDRDLLDGVTLPVSLYATGDLDNPLQTLEADDENCFEAVNPVSLRRCKWRSPPA